MYMKYAKHLALVMVLMMVLQLCACSSTPTADSSQAPTINKSSGKASANDSEATVDTPVSVESFEGPTEPAKAPTGIKVALIPGMASMSGAMVPCEAVMEIGERYNWEMQVFDGGGTPDIQNQCIMNAITWDADIIYTTSILASTVQQGIKAANDAGIPITSGSNGTDDPNPRIEDLEYDFAFDVGPDYESMGRAMAEWMDANKSASGEVAVFSSPGAYSLIYFEKGLLAGLDTSDLHYDGVHGFTLEQTGDQLNRMVISYLTNNPDTEYVSMPFDPAAVGVVEALEVAGFEDVKVLGVLGNTEMCALISQGGLATATAAYDNVYLGYASADQMIRILNKQDLATPRGENLPYTIIDASSVPQPGKPWAPAFDYKSAFYALWD